jgi:RND family efflux transporter MFP subunit
MKCHGTELFVSLSGSLEKRKTLWRFPKLFYRLCFLSGLIALSSCACRTETGSGDSARTPNQAGTKVIERLKDLTSPGQAKCHIPSNDPSLAGLTIRNVEIASQELPVFLSLGGTIQPESGKEVDVNTRILGRVVRVAAQIGDTVKVGQLLAVLDSQEVSELEAEVIEAKSKLRVAKAQQEREKQIYEEQRIRPKALIAAKADFQQAKAQLELADAELQRQEGLHHEKITSAKTYMEAKAADEKARADFDEAKLALQREEGLFKNQALMKKDFEIAAAESARAEQHLDTLKQRLIFLGMDSNSVANVLETGKISGELKITAPVSGVISHEDVAVGEVVHTDLSMFKILDLSTVLVKAEVPEINISLVKLGDRVVVTMPSYPDEEFDATISYVADHINPVTHSLGVSARLINKDRKFKANMSANIDFQGPTKNILACPRSALIHRDSGVAVFVLDGKNYVQRQIKSGLEAKDFVEITSGLREKDRVVTEGKQALIAICDRRH